MGISISWLEISRWDLSAIDKEGFLTNCEDPSSFEQKLISTHTG